MSIESEKSAKEFDGWDLRAISTQWSAIGDANSFVLRYVNAIEHYLEMLLKNRDDVEEVLQKFLVKILERGFTNVSPGKGKFRHYLIRAVRNEVIDWHRSQAKKGLSLDPDQLNYESDKDWDRHWQACILDRSWKRLEQHQTDHEGNWCFLVLRASLENPGVNSEQLAQLVSEETKASMNSAAFRKQLSRARKLYAEFIVFEVSQTLESPTPEMVKEELGDLRLMGFVVDHLPDGWK